MLPTPQCEIAPHWRCGARYVVQAWWAHLKRGEWEAKGIVQKCLLPSRETTLPRGSSRNSATSVWSPPESSSLQLTTVPLLLIAQKAPPRKCPVIRMLTTSVSSSATFEESQGACGPCAPPLRLQESEPQTLLFLARYRRTLRTDESNPACSFCDCPSASSKRLSLRTVASCCLVLTL